MSSKNIRDSSNNNLGHDAYDSALPASPVMVYPIDAVETNLPEDEDKKPAPKKRPSTPPKKSSK